ncbi:MAG: AprI/Inh family metalloprotease inhibitor [Pseudomonadota bacterium]
MMRRAAFFLLLCCTASPVFAQAEKTLQPGELSGDWTATDPNPSGKCMLSFEVSTDSLGYRAYAFGCTGPDLHLVAGWRLRGTSILLTDATGKSLINLKMKDRTHFEGSGPSGVPVEISR